MIDHMLYCCVIIVLISAIVMFIFYILLLRSENTNSCYLSNLLFGIKYSNTKLFNKKSNTCELLKGLFLLFATNRVFNYKVLDHSKGYQKITVKKDKDSPYMFTMENMYRGNIVYLALFKNNEIRQAFELELLDVELIEKYPLSFLDKNKSLDEFLKYFDRL